MTTAGLRTIHSSQLHGTAAYAVALRDGRVVVAGEAPTTVNRPQQPMVPVVRLLS